MDYSDGHRESGWDHATAQTKTDRENRMKTVNDIPRGCKLHHFSKPVTRTCSVSGSTPDRSIHPLSSASKSTATRKAEDAGSNPAGVIGLLIPSKNWHEVHGKPCSAPHSKADTMR